MSGQIGDGRGFALHLLHIVLAEVAQAQRVCFANGFGAEDLGDSQQAHGCGIAMGLLTGAVHALAHFRKPLLQRRVHQPDGNGSRLLT